MELKTNSLRERLAWVKHLIFGKAPPADPLEEIREQLEIFFEKQYKFVGEWIRTTEIMIQLELTDKYQSKAGYAKIAAHIGRFSELFMDIQKQIDLGIKNRSKIKQKILEAHVVIEKQFPDALGQIATIRDIWIPKITLKSPKETIEHQLMDVAAEYIRHAKAQIRIIKEIADQL